MIIGFMAWQPAYVLSFVRGWVVKISGRVVGIEKSLWWTRRHGSESQSHLSVPVCSQAGHKHLRIQFPVSPAEQRISARLSQGHGWVMSVVNQKLSNISVSLQSGIPWAPPCHLYMSLTFHS